MSDDNFRFLKSIDDFGVVDGLVAIVGGHPFDTVKIRLQTVGQIDYGGGEFLYNGAWDCFFKILKREGFMSLYKGLMVPLVSVFPTCFLTCYAFDFLAFQTSNDDKRLDRLAVLRNGVLAGMLPAPIVTPMERIKTSLQVPTGYNRDIPTFYSVVNTIYKNDGHYGFYRGVSFTIIRDGVANGLAFLTYYMLKFHYVKDNERFQDTEDEDRDKNLKYLGIFLSGGVSGVIGAIVTAPIDMVKTRYQFGDIPLSELLFNIHYEADRRNMPLKQIYFSGLPFLLIKSFCQYGTMFLSYELYKEFARRKIVIEEDITKSDETIKEEIDKLEKIEENMFDITFKKRN